MVDYLDAYVARADAVRAQELTGTTSPFTITVRFTGGLTRTQQDAFVAAADRWARPVGRRFTRAARPARGRTAPRRPRLHDPAARR